MGRNMCRCLGGSSDPWNTPGMQPWASAASTALHPHHLWDSGWFNHILTILAGLLSFQAGATCDRPVIATILPPSRTVQVQICQNSRQCRRLLQKTQTLTVNRVFFVFFFDLMHPSHSLPNPLCACLKNALKGLMASTKSLTCFT